MELSSHIYPDGQFILYDQNDSKRSSDPWALPLSGVRKPFPLATTTFDEALGQFSPDGRWVAYQSNESGLYEIYIKSFAGPDRSQPVSSGGGTGPRWSHDGKELFYIAADGNLMAAPIQIAGQTLKAGTPTALFHAPILGGDQVAQQQQYAVAPDGNRFLINTIADESATSPIIIVTNWAGALKK